MTIEELNNCITRGHLMTSSELYTNLELVEEMMTFSYRNLSNKEYNLVMATKLFLQYQIQKRGDYEG